MTAPAAATHVALFESDGRERVIGGNTPVLLDNPDGVYLIASGRAEVFSVSAVDGRADGVRHHFFSAAEGDLLFGMDLARYGEGQGLLAVGVVGTRLLELSQTQLRAQLDDPAFAASLAPAVERWVEALSSGSVRTIVLHPRADLQIEPGQHGALADSQRVRARRAVAWVEQVGAATLFLGMEELADLPPEALFPLTAASWLQAIGSVQLASTDTIGALTSGRAWSGLDAFYGALFRCEFFNTRLASADELNRLRDKVERDRRATAAALAGLADIVESRRVAIAGARSDDPLLAACTTVGNAMRIAITAPPKPKREERDLERLDDILRASRVRSRVVVLKGDWWAEESWPMLAFIEHAGGARPVSLLWNERRYELHDPAAGTHEPVTAAVAATLAPKAHTFYRPFPNQQLSPMNLLRFGLANHGFDLVRPLLVGLAAGILALFPPYFTGLLVDSVIPEVSRSHLVQIAIVMAVIGVTTTCFDIVRNLSILRLELNLSASIQPAMWDRLLALPITFFRRFAAGDLASRVGTIEGIRQVLSTATVQAAMTTLFSTFLLAQLFYYSWQLALIGLALVAVAMAAAITAGVINVVRYRESVRIEGRLSALVLQLLSGIAKLRVTAAEDRAFARWAREFAAKKTIDRRTGTVANWLETFNAVFPVLATMLIFWMLVSNLQGDGGLSAGGFIAFNAAFGTFVGQMLQLSNTAISTLVVVPLYQRAQPILDATTEVDDTKLDPGELNGAITVDRVSFRYHDDGPLVLDDVSLRIAPGEYVAIVGPSGSGKSTLFRLLLGLDTPQAGAIYFDGKDLAQLDVGKTRRLVGTVMQTGRIRAGSVLENIVGSRQLTLDDAWEAARMAGFDADLRQMPMGMQTVLQQGGATLSGGQRQRLMIARAIVNKPRILLFDEATSALDNRTQAIVSQSLRELQATRVAIAHRLSTIRGADRIYVLDAGRVVQIGSYDELAAQEGLFAELIRRQIA